MRTEWSDELKRENRIKHENAQAYATSQQQPASSNEKQDHEWHQFYLSYFFAKEITLVRFLEIPLFLYGARYKYEFTEETE